MQEYPIIPIAKPRMTRKDKWNPSNPAKRYFAYKRQLKRLGVSLPESGYHVVFVLPMPESWSKGKKKAYDGMPHQQTPDKDNLEKGLLDALFGRDEHIWDGRVTKVWGREGKIMIGQIGDFSDLGCP